MSLHLTRPARRGAALGLGLLLLAAPAAWAASVDDYTDPLSIAASGGATAVINTAAFDVQGGEPTAADGSCPARTRTAWFSIVGNGLPITAAIDATTYDVVVAAFPASGPPATPTFGTRLACHDGPGNTGTITFPSTRGQRYLVQVGGKGNAGGSVRMAFTVTRPADDDRAAASVVPLGTPVTVDQSGATSEVAEILSCGASGYAGTVWFRFTTARTVDAQFSSTANLTGAANPADTVLTVYPAGSTTPTGCNDDAGPSAGPSTLALRLAPGEYDVQVGAKGADTPALGAGPVTLSVTDLDRDADGVPTPADCNDADAGIRPGAVDAPGDGLDQDCQAGDARFPTLRSAIKGSFALQDGRTRFKSLTVRQVAAGTTIAVTCRGRGCPQRIKPRRASKDQAKVNVLGALAGRRLKPGARVIVTATRPGFTGLVTTYRIRAGGPPKRVDRCLDPGSSSATSCSG
jgi:hypothetical protein